MANTIVLKDLLMKETIAYLDKSLVVAKHANRAYTGDLKQKGNTVSVQIFPRLTLQTGGTAGADITSQYFVITSEDLVINQIAQANYEITDLEVIQSNLDLRSEVARELAYQLAVTYDSFVSALAIAGAGNEVTTVALTKSNVYGEVEKMRVLLGDDNVTDNLALFVSPQVASFIRQSPEWDGFRE